MSGKELQLQVTITTQCPISLHILAANVVLQLVDEIWWLLRSLLSVLLYLIYSPTCKMK